MVLQAKNTYREHRTVLPPLHPPHVPSPQALGQAITLPGLLWPLLDSAQALDILKGRGYDHPSQPCLCLPEPHAGGPPTSAFVRECHVADGLLGPYTRTLSPP